MLILAVETATSRHSVAVVDGTHVLGERQGDSHGSHTRWLIPTIDELLHALDLKLADFSGLAVSIGPGSFTGLRAGLATVTGFRTALDLPLVVVPTLEALAWNVRSETTLVCPMLKARAQEVYWAGFRWKEESLIRVTEEQVGSLDQLVQSVKEQALGIGEGWMIHQQAIMEKSELWQSARGNVHETSAVSVGLASLQRFRDGEIAEVGVSPRYVLPSYAEVSREAHREKRG